MINLLSDDYYQYQFFKVSITRIYNDYNQVVGAGFLVSDRYIITCAHVISESLNLPEDSQEIPKKSLTLDFPFIDNDEKLTAQVVFWKPVSFTEKIEDIAGLQLNNNLPNMPQPVRLVTPEDVWEHSFRIFGFPKGHSHGIPVSGKLLDTNSKGWLLMGNVEGTGYWIEPGFSGAPVWDEQLRGVVGMAVAYEKRRENVKAAFLIPTQVLRQAWNKISQPDIISPRPKIPNPPSTTEQQRELQQRQDQIKERIATLKVSNDNFDIYNQLCDSLKKEEWNDADKETIQIILGLTKRKKYGFLREKDIENISCIDLLKIDLLWLKASNNRFGFSVQRYIWLRKLDIRLELAQLNNSQNLLNFGKCVGWYANDELLHSRDSYKFSLDAPEGHLPSLRFPCSEFARNNTNWWQSWKRIFKNFLIRTDNCLLT